MTNLVVVGEIVNTHGVNGEVRVISRTDFPEKRYAKGTSLVVKHRDSDAEMKVTVAQYRTHKNFDLLRFENYNSIHDVEQFKGATLYIHTNDLEPLDKNEFYYYEIIGCTVITEDNQQLGKVVEIFETGANDIWVVEPFRDGQQILLPYIPDVIKKVDVVKKQIVVHLIEGLVE